MSSMDKAEFTITVCIRTPRKFPAGLADKWAGAMHGLITKAVTRKGATIIHSHVHVRRWADNG